jgi:broad specificity phosphatase PhoE
MTVSPTVSTTIAAVTTILLARHGESDWNAELRWQGHADRPLTERGRAQAAALAERLDGFPLAAIYSSDLQRARETADAVGARRNLPVVTRTDLREVDVGSWSGLTRGEVELRFPRGMRAWLAGEAGWDAGETYEQMSERVLGAMRQIAAAHPEDHVLVVAHGGGLRAIHAHALGLSVQAHRRTAPVEPNARLSAVVVENGAMRRLELPARV